MANGESIDTSLSSLGKAQKKTSVAPAVSAISDRDPSAPRASTVDRERVSNRHRTFLQSLYEAGGWLDYCELSNDPQNDGLIIECVERGWVEVFVHQSSLFDLD